MSLEDVARDLDVDEDADLNVDLEDGADRDGDDVEQLGESSPEDLWGWLESHPSGSVREADYADVFSPEVGGLNRVAWCLDHLTDEGASALPVWVHLFVLAPVEVAISYELLDVEDLRPDRGDGDDDEDDEDGVPEKFR